MRFLPSRSDRQAFGKIAEEYDLVYFGTVDPRVDSDYKVVRGLTLSPYARDENYTTGNVYNHEIAFLQRSRSVLGRSGQKINRKWTILQINLSSYELPNALVDGRIRSDEYGSLLAATQRWQEIGWHHLSNPEFSKLFAVYCRPESVMRVSGLLNDEVQTMLTSHFSQFDYEITADKLIVYATDVSIDLQKLDHMLRIGLWLARRLDLNNAVV